MIFHVVSDGAGGYIGYWEGPGDGLALGFVGVICALAPIMLLVLFGEYLLLPILVRLFGIFLLITPDGNGVHQSMLLAYTKAALSIPLFAYGITCFAYTMGRVSKIDGAVSGLWVLLMVVLGAGATISFAVFTYGLGTPFVILWGMGFGASMLDGFPMSTNFILHATYLGGIGVFIYGVIQTIREKDKGGIYVLPKLIAFGLGCIPLIVLMLLSGLNHWVLMIVTVALFFGIYYIYNFVLKQNSLFADWLMYPFLTALGCHFLVGSYSDHIFPSEIIDGLYDFLAPLDQFLGPSYAVCTAFSKAISDLLYGISKLLLAILPNVGLNAPHVNIPGIIGGIIGIVITAIICNFAGSLYLKRVRKKS